MPLNFPSAIRYIHAADLHLDAPFQGVAGWAAASPQLAGLLADATFCALKRLFELCEAERPDFLVLSGDIYNEENFSVRAQLAVRDGCARLEPLGIRVFLAHGNHDPLNSKFNYIGWPGNVSIFGFEPDKILLERNGAPLAMVHGISHATGREGRNLARLFRRDQRISCFQLGVLHCTLDGQAKSDRYAPCCLDDLRSTGLDAWALGHVHQGKILCEDPFIAYAGSSQGLNINESGPRGCYMVTVMPKDDGYHCDAAFHRLAPLEWQTLEIALDGLENLDELDRRISNTLEEAAATADPACLGLVARLVLAGRTPLDSLLRQKGTCEDLEERLRHFSSASTPLWLKDIQVRTSPPLNRDELLKREDLVGELTRLVCGMRDEPSLFQELITEALEPLYDNPRLRKALQKPEEAALLPLFEDAEKICLDMLENH